MKTRKVHQRKIIQNRHDLAVSKQSNFAQPPYRKNKRQTRVSLFPRIESDILSALGLSSFYHNINILIEKNHVFQITRKLRTLPPLSNDLKVTPQQKDWRNQKSKKQTQSLHWKLSSTNHPSNHWTKNLSKENGSCRNRKTHQKNQLAQKSKVKLFLKSNRTKSIPWLNQIKKNRKNGDRKIEQKRDRSRPN